MCVYICMSLYICICVYVYVCIRIYLCMQCSVEKRITIPKISLKANSPQNSVEDLCCLQLLIIHFYFFPTSIHGLTIMTRFLNLANSASTVLREKRIMGNASILFSESFFIPKRAGCLKHATQLLDCLNGVDMVCCKLHI